MGAEAGAGKAEAAARPRLGGRLSIRQGAVLGGLGGLAGCVLCVNVALLASSLLAPPADLPATASRAQAAEASPGPTATVVVVVPTPPPEWTAAPGGTNAATATSATGAVADATTTRPPAATASRTATATPTSTASATASATATQPAPPPPTVDPQTAWNDYEAALLSMDEARFDLETYDPNEVAAATATARLDELGAALEARIGTAREKFGVYAAAAAPSENLRLAQEAYMLALLDFTEAHVAFWKDYVASDGASNPTLEAALDEALETLAEAEAGYNEVVGEEG
jgi:hypothetical protein